MKFYFGLALNTCLNNICLKKSVTRSVNIFVNRIAKILIFIIWFQNILNNEC